MPQPAEAAMHTPRHIFQIIEQNRALREPVLNLRGQALLEIPPEIRELEHLQQLRLKNNAIQRLPGWLKDLPNLQFIELNINPLHQLGDVPNLVLDWGVWRRLNPAPEQVAGLWLRWEDEVIINELLRLPDLRRLDLSEQRLRKIPRAVFRLTQLQVLDLRRNKLEALPSEIFQLQNLTQLDLSYNGLSALPPEIAQLQNLTQLDLGQNKFSALPPEITQLHDLRELNLKDNSLEEPPLESLDLEGMFDDEADITKLRAWFRDAAAQGMERIYEAKLLIIGEGGAGKTTLAWRLMDADASMPGEDQSTEGIDVWRWLLAYETAEGESKKFRLNIWDFGGQDIYHATHQFFLSKDALYALVANTRRNDTDFYWWLSVVEKLGGGSPVLLVKNEIDDRVFALDENRLRGRFKNLEKVIPANLASRRGLKEIVEFIRYRMLQLPHIGTPYPRTWLKVREALEEQRPEPYISWDAYLKICRDTGLPDNSAPALMSLLHNLGVCLHFEDEPLLAKTVILKPTWATEAVYRVLDDRDVQLQNGCFSRADVKRIWQTPKKLRHSLSLNQPVQHEWQPKDYAAMHHELLAMMQRFELCYTLPQDGRYIAPQLLDRKKAAYDFPEGGLSIKYDYTGFMPKGLTGYLLVRRHEWIEAERTRAWRHGAVFAHFNTRAEVIEDPDRRELTVRLVGENCRDLATVLMDELETIHRRFKNLEFRVLIPCQCDKIPQGELDLAKVYKASSRQRDVQCDECLDMLNAEKILSGIFTPMRLEKDAKRYGSHDRKHQRVERQINEGGDVHYHGHQSGETVNSNTEENKAVKNNPWTSGSFYLVNYAIILAGLTLAAYFTDGLIFPLVIIGALLSAGAVGALQLRNDEQLSQKNFLDLMKESYRRLLLLRASKVKRET
ncbi:MAG: GTPase [Gammaproteobacteria bacterium]|nr:GTPase [Gammaproteobacteria bacterium]